MNPDKLRIAVLRGGPSAEREVSLRSGEAVLRALVAAGHEAIDVQIDEPKLPELPPVDAVFIALHGRFGEDGGVQSELDARGLPYTGPGAEASRVAFDKELTNNVMREAGIPTPASAMLRKGETCALPWPRVIKPPREGSSIGLHIVGNPAEWDAAWEMIDDAAGPMLVEEFIGGRELTVGIVGDEALPVVEICAPEGRYDYRAKYTRGLTEYRVPAPLDESVAREAQRSALRLFHALGACGMSRVDFRLRGDDCFALEINTIPGFTETSLLPKAAAVHGLDFTALCLRLIELAMKSH